MAKQAFTIYAVSDATGDLAHHLAIAASLQFGDVEIKVLRKMKVASEKKIRDLIADAKRKNAVILFTMVDQDMRRMTLTEAAKEGVVAMDVLGPVLDMLSHYVHKLPSHEPGLQYRVTQDYYRRTEAVEFAVRHDDGLGLENIEQADIVLLGVSRTSKTPLSIYLAYHGYRCASIPIVSGAPLPAKVMGLDRKKMVGLIISPEKLASHRSTRLRNLGRSDSENYAKPEHIEAELRFCRELFSQLEGITVMDVTGKAIEEVAAEIINRHSIVNNPA